jgi:HEAT repeat protein
VQGSGATLVFVLVVAARVTDLTLSDGAARTSLSAAYQAVPTPLRLATQAGVEGLAVPVAIGASGVVLLALQLMGGTGGLALPVLTSVVVVAWTVVAAFVYRGYRTNLLASLRRRTLDPSELTIDGAAGLSVIQRLVESDDERDVRLALDALTVAAHADLSTALQRLTTDGRIGVRIDALERLAELDPQQGASAARTGLDDPSHHVRAVCLRVLAESGEPSDLPSIAAHTADESTEVRIAVAAAMAHLGDDDVRAEIAGEISRLSQHQGVDQRIIAAQMLGACGSAGSIDRSALGVLLADSEHDVANEALAATRWPDDDELIVQVADRLHDRATGSAAMEALARGNDATLEFIDRSLSGHEYGRRGQELLARVCREMGGASAALVLRRHVEHLDREVGLAVMTALSAVLGSPSSGADPRMESERVEASDASEAVLRVDLEHAAYVLRALLALEDETAADLLCAALRDELALTRQRVMAALSIRHGTEGLQRVAFQFAQRDPRSHALALEWLDVTLSGADRAVVAMLEPGLTDGERLRGLSRWFPIASASPLAIVRDLLEDGEHRWRRSWLTACALYALSGLSDPTLDVGTPGGIESLMKLQPHDESDIVHETLAGLRARRPSGD